MRQTQLAMYNLNKLYLEYSAKYLLFFICHRFSHISRDFRIYSLFEQQIRIPKICTSSCIF